MTALHHSIDAALAMRNPAVLAFIQQAEARRARLIRFAETVAYGRQWELRMGDRPLKFSRLSLDALEELASDLAADFWSHKRFVREQRAFFAARQGRAA